MNHRKSVTFVELKEKGNLNITTRPITPLREMKEIRGSYEELMNRDYYLNTDLRECYLHVILTDEEDVPEAMRRMQPVYQNIMKLTYDNTRTQRQQNPLELTAEPESSPVELFGLLYEKQYNRELSQVQREYLEKLVESIREGQA